MVDVWNFNDFKLQRDGHPDQFVMFLNAPGDDKCVTATCANQGKVFANDTSTPASPVVFCTSCVLVMIGRTTLDGSWVPVGSIGMNGITGIVCDPCSDGYHADCMKHLRRPETGLGIGPILDCECLPVHLAFGPTP